MFYFNSQKVQEEWTFSDETTEMINGRVVFLKLPVWVLMLPKIFGIAIVILFISITYSFIVGGFL